MTLHIESGVTAALLFLIVAGPILLFVITNRMAQSSNWKSLDKVFFVLFVAVLVDGAMTLGALLTDVPVKLMVAARLSEITAIVVDASLFQDTLYGACLAVCAALAIALAKHLAAAGFARMEWGHRQNAI